MTRVGGDGAHALGTVLVAGALYFAGVFAVGFVLGVVRELWLVPAVGRRAGELLENPLMLVAMVLAARFIVRRSGAPATTAGRLVAGFVALVLLLVAELTVVLSLRGLTVAEYVEGRDPVSGSVYVVMLIVFALMPSLVGRAGGGRPG